MENQGASEKPKHEDSAGTMPWPTENPWEREEWDFRAAGKHPWYDDKTYGAFEFLGEDEVLQCWRYEFGRHDADAEYELKSRESNEIWQNWHKQRSDPNALLTGTFGKATSDCFDRLLKRYSDEKV
jgi:hypothetical protein